MDWTLAFKHTGSLAAALAVGTLLAALGLLPPTEAQVAEMITTQVRAMEQNTATGSDSLTPGQGGKFAGQAERAGQGVRLAAISNVVFVARKSSTRTNQLLVTRPRNLLK